METPPARALLQNLQGRREEMVALLGRLARAESPSTAPAAQGAVFDLLAGELAGIGYGVRRLPGRASGGMLLGSPGPSRRRSHLAGGFQLLLGHADTVWPLGTLERMPVARDESGRRLHGPGVYDMKAGLVQGLAALRALADLGLAPPVAPVFLVSSDEEVDSTESAPAIRRLARRARRVFVLEPALGPEGRLKTRRKGVGRFTVTVHGRAAHAGLDPERGASAILELAHVIQSLHALSDPARGTTVGVGLVHGGQAINVVPPEATAEADVRVLSQEDAARVEAGIRALEPTVPGTTLEIRGGFSRAPLEATPGNRILWHAAQRHAGKLGIALDEGTAGGGSDGNLTSPLAPTLDGLGAVGDGAHAAHEHVEIDRMPERAALLALLLLDPVVG